MKATRLIISMMLVAGCLRAYRGVTVDEPVGRVLKIVGKAYWKESSESQPYRDRPLHVGEAVRCERGCVLTLELYNKTVTITKEGWYPIPTPRRQSRSFRTQAAPAHARPRFKIGENSARRKSGSREARWSSCPGTT